MFVATPVQFGDDPVFELHREALARRAKGRRCINATLGVLMDDDEAVRFADGGMPQRELQQAGEVQDGERLQRQIHVLPFAEHLARHVLGEHLVDVVR